MPIFRAGQGLCYFADVPGCGGAAMVRHLEARFGPLALHDPAHTEAPPKRRWSRTSPQHVGRKTLARLFPPGFFAAAFALVRHPAERLRAVYAFQRDVERSIPRTTDFHAWLDDIAERILDDPFVFDNALRPMADLVPEEAEAFRLEDGPEPVAEWLDGLDGHLGGPWPALVLPPAAEGGPELSAFDLERIGEIYAEDFARFGYPGGGRVRRSRNSAER